MNKLIKLLLISAFLPYLVFVEAAVAASIEPASINVNMVPGQTLTLERIVTLDASGPAASRVDVVFLADNTGSMGGVINTVRSNAQTILDAISGGDPRFTGIDVQFGVASYNGDPREFGGNTDNKAARAYRLLQAVTDSRDDVAAALGQWRAGGGGDAPEANFFALHQVATQGGATDGIGSTDLVFSTGAVTGWRSGAARVIVWFGDVRSHTTTVNLDEVIAALADNDVIVAAINTRAANSGIDSLQQATQIVAATGGSLTNNVRGTAATIDAILNAVESATDTVDLSLTTAGLLPGLDVSFTCISAQGCEDVAAGESRRFAMQLNAGTEGSYEFDTLVPQIAGLIANDSVNVRACVSDLTARAKRDKVELIWTDTGADHYVVYRSDEVDGNYQRVAATTSRYAVYVDRGLLPNTAYYYQVREQTAGGEETCSSVTAVATTLLRGRPDGTPINVAPVFTSTPVTAVNEDDTFSYTMAAADANGDVLTFSLVSGPTGMSVSGDVLSWTPGNANVGPQNIVVRVSDPSGLFDSQVFTLTVINTNDAPIITSSAPLLARVNEPYQYAVNAIDIDAGDTLAFALPQAPAGMSVSAGGLITWTPEFTQQGDFDVVLRVVDQSGAFVEQAFTITVEAVNNPPQITSLPLTNIEVGADYSYQLTISDPDEGDIHQYSLLQGPPGAGVDENTGLFSWPAAVAGTYTISLRVTDSGGLTDTQTFELSVTVPNAVPVITSTPVTLAQEGSSYRYRIVATDADGDALTYTLLAAPAGMTIDAGGEISWLPALSQVGPQDVVVEVADGLAAVTQSFTIDVAARPNTAPVINSTPAGSVFVGENFSYQVVALDGEGDPLTFSLPQAPAGMAISATGLVTWVANVAAGLYDVAVRVEDDRGAAVVQAFVLDVQERPNTAPVITSAPLTTATVGVLYQYAVQASDDDGEVLSYALTQSPAGMSIGGGSGLIVWTPQAGDIGTAAVSVRVTDPRGGSATQSFNILVGDVPNSAPVISSAPPTAATVDQPYAYQVTAVDPEGDALSYALTTAPAGMSISAGGLINWTPAGDQAGNNAVVLTVTDSRGAAATQSYTIVVAQAPNELPVITSAPVTSAVVGIPYQYSVSATDADGDMLAFSLPLAPAGMNIDADTGLIAWLPDAAQVGDRPVTVRVSDGRGFVEQSFAVTVTEEPPAIAIDVIITPAIADPDELITIQVQTSGASNPAITVTQNGVELPLDSANRTTFSATEAGVYPLQVRVVSDDGRTETTTAFARVRAAGDNAPPAVSINTPVDGNQLLDITDIIGSVSDDNLFRYRLLLAPAGTSQFSEFAAGTDTVLNASLGALDPSLFRNGLYRLLLVAEDINGLTAQDFVDIQIDGEFKPGVVQLSFTDMTVPVAGIPITIERSYDSRVKTGRDLGIGWDLSLRQGSYTNNREPGEGWDVRPSGGFIRIPCSVSVELLHHQTEIRLSDSESYEFRPTASFFGFGSTISGGCLGQAGFTQIGGVPGATLVPLENNNVFFANGSGTLTFDLGDPRFGDPWEPQQVRLRTPDGREFDVDLRFGITRIADGSGGQLFISAAGVVNGAGAGVQFVRDGEGRITRIIDPLGNSLAYEYDAAGDLVAFDNQLGERTTYQYSNRIPHHLTAIVLPDGRLVSQFDYDENGRMVEACNESGCTAAEYDLVGRTQTTIDASGRSLTHVYDESGNILSETDALGNTHSFEYDADGNITAIVDPEGNTTRQTWDAQGNLLSLVEPHDPGADPADFTTTYSYDAEGNLLTTRNPAGGELNQSYDASGNVLAVTDESGNTLSSYSYDSAGRPLSEADPFGAISFSYAADGLLDILTDESGTVTRFGHDAAGNVTSFTRDGVTAAMTYDAMGRMGSADFGQGISLNYTYNFGDDWASAGGTTIAPINRNFTVEGKPRQVVQADGSSVSWSYDAAGRLLGETDALGATTVYGYDGAGRLVSETSPRGGVTRFELDRTGRTTALVNAEGERSRYDYYPNGQLRQMTDAGGGAWSFAYTPTTVTTTDPLLRTTLTSASPQGLLERITHADGTSRSWTYLTSTDYLDASEMPTSVTDEGGRVRNFSYDAQGRLQTAGDLAGEVAVLSYGDGQLSRVTDAAGQSISFDYDILGAIGRATFADGTSKTMTYDAARRLSTVTLSSGSSKTLSYDSLDRLIADSRSSGENFTFSWDGNGQLLSAGDALGTASYAYDANGSLQSFAGSTGERVDYQRDAVGRIVEKRLSNAGGSQVFTTRYEYDSAGRLGRIIDPNLGETLFAYDIAGRLTSRTLPNGVTTTYTYGGRDLLQEVVHSNSAGTVISSVSYLRNAGGEPSRITWQDGSYVALAYDSALRIVDEQFFDAAGVLEQRIQYEYDAVGNRTRRIVDGAAADYSYGAGHRLTAVSGAESQRYDYDADGRVSRIQRAGDSSDLTYNMDGQLNSVTRAGVALDYIYDASGRRIQAGTGADTRRFLMAVPAQGNFEAPQLVADAASNIQQAYLYHGDQPLQRIDAAGNVRYYLTDAQGSVIGITDEAGNLLGSARYDAFGRIQSQAGDMAVPGSAGGDFRFHGQWLEGDTGLYYLRARDYDPESGRFLSADPAAPDYFEPESLNRYLFANSNPYFYSDPSGRFTLVSVSISINVRSTLTSIATNIVKDYFIDKARSVVGSLVLGALKNFVALRGFNPWDNGARPWEAGNRFEQEIREMICDRILPSSLREIVWFEPGVTAAGDVTSNGLNCGDGGRRGGSETRPDFILSGTEPLDLRKRGLKAYLIGEVKLSLKSFYNAYRHDGGRQRSQFNAIIQFAKKRVYSRTAVFLALYNGGKQSSQHQRQLSQLLSREAVSEGVIPVMVSAF